jgi:methylated-DNA-[protein]-cysteine S-methyltransferase
MKLGAKVVGKAPRADLSAAFGCGAYARQFSLSQLLEPIMQYEVFDTAVGPIGIVVRPSNGRIRLVSVRVGHPTIAATEIAILKSAPDAVASRGLPASKVFVEYAKTGVADFSSIILDDEQASPFDRAVRAACRKIAFGTTVTYAELAELAAWPRRAARAVGGTMRRNPFPIVVPCHRVVPTGKSWALGNYSAPQGPELKRRLLELEGFRTSETPRSRGSRRTSTRRADVASTR